MTAAVQASLQPHLESSNIYLFGLCLQLGKGSATGTRTRVARVRAEYPNQLDYSGSVKNAVGSRPSG